MASKSLADDVLRLTSANAWQLTEIGPLVREGAEVGVDEERVAGFALHWIEG